MMRQLIPSILLALVCSEARVDAQQRLTDIPLSDPAVEQASFKVPDGFDVKLWASDPILAKPTQISFDHKGRLWVSTTRTYPQLNVNQEPNDQIVILEDTNRDGTADKSSVFYDKLIIPGGVLPDGSGGAYVAHAEEFIHLKDSDGDGKADQQQVLLSGFGTEDTHHTLHRLKWGPAGLIYMQQGYYIGTHVETLYGPRRLNGGGLWSYDTDTRRLEIYSRGLINPWGMVFDRWGQIFQTDGAGGEGINYTFPDSVFMGSPHEHRFMNGLNPGRPKLCGLEIISGGHFPDSWQGVFVANDFRANNIDSYRLSDQGSGYGSTLSDDLMQSSHVSFRPIDVVMGPDGAMYVADWYNPIIQHGEVDFRDKRRDKVHGRIWRITAKKRPLVAQVDYEKATIAELLEHLKSEADWMRLNAKQALKNHDETKVTAALVDWVAKLDGSDPDVAHHRLEALWALQTISSKPTQSARKLAHTLVRSPDFRARAAATCVLYHWSHSEDSLKTLELLVRDPHPRVRREAVTALGRSRSPQAVLLALRALDLPMDQFLDFALWRTCRLLEPYWLPSFLDGSFALTGNADHMAFALRAVARPEALAPLVDRLEKGDARIDASTATLVGKIGSAKDLDRLVKIAAQKGHRFAAAAGHALVEAAQDRQLVPTEQRGRLQACQQLLASDQNASVADGCRLIGLWKVKSMYPVLTSQLQSTIPAIRQAAARSLADTGNTAALKIDTSQWATTAHRITAAVALSRVDTAAGADAISKLLTQTIPESAVEKLVGAIVVKKGGAKALTNALGKLTIPQQNAITASRMVETSGHGKSALMKTLAQTGKLKPLTQSLDQSQLQALVARIPNGDAKRGKLIYERAALACVSCHAIDGKGGHIGPDLSGIGASAPTDYMIESLTDPSKKIKEGYRMSTISLKNGDVIAGAVVREEPNVLVMRNMANVETRVPKSSIKKRSTSPVSMMPSGLTASLREDEFIDLIHYLTLLGKQK